MDHVTSVSWQALQRGLMGAAGSTGFFTKLAEIPLPPAWDPDAGQARCCRKFLCSCF